MVFGEGLVLVEDGFEQRRRKVGENEKRERDYPGAEPVAARPAADDPVEEQHDGRANDHRKSQSLCLVAEPAAPALHADTVAPADVVGKGIQRHSGQRDDDEKDGKEEKALQPAAAQEAFSPGGQTGGSARNQQEPENPQAPKRVYKVQPVADAAESDGPGQLVGRQGVGLRAGLCGGWLFGG